MNRLLDFKPLADVTLPSAGKIPCAGLTLIVGPNSSGKTQFLNDLYSRLCGEPRRLIVAETVEINKPDYKLLIQYLERDGYLRRRVNPGNGREELVARTTYVGTGQALPIIEVNQAEAWYSAYDGTPDIQSSRPNAFLGYFGRLLVTRLSLDRRLLAFGALGVINFESDPPAHDLHAFHIDDRARRILAAESHETFGKALWSDNMGGNLLCLRVNDGPLPSAEDRLSFEKMTGYRTIETEGDGLKSYAAICIALLLKQRPVCLIDEPETCLHPPQAYSLGRFIARHGVSKDVATFVATHSSQVLRGIVQSTQEVEIVRLTRNGGQFHARRLPAQDLVIALKKPTLRAESILDGIFSESVVIVEADGDRLVYHTTWETLAEELRLDVHFAAVGGLGGVADACRLYRTLHIPVAIIADLARIIHRSA